MGQVGALELEKGCHGRKRQGRQKKENGSDLFRGEGRSEPGQLLLWEALSRVQAAPESTFNLARLRFWENRVSPLETLGPIT
jgi:hypothetical protein